MGATAKTGADGAPQPDAEPVIGGVRALLYVAVQAALSEGFPEEEVFEHEKLSPEAWQRADEAWASALADSAEKDSKLFDNYDATYNAYKWAFHRVIEPLESDLDAYMNFTGHLNKSEDQKQFLGELGLDQNDAIRLQQIWAARVANDAALRERMAARMGKEPGEIPPLQVPPKKLPPPVNKQPITVPPEADETAAAEAKKPPPPPLIAPLPTFSGARPAGPGAPVAAQAGASPSAEGGEATPPREAFGYYVPPPERVGSRAVSAPPLVPPRVPSVAPPAIVSAAGSAAPPALQRAPAPRLSLHDYTTALGEMLAFPGSEGRVASKYGLNLESFAHERVAWDNQLAQTPSLQAEYRDKLSRAVAHWQALARRR